MKEVGGSSRGGAAVTDDDRSLASADEEDPPSTVLVGSVYKSIRWALCDLLLRLGNRDDHDPSQLPPLLDDLESVSYLVERYMAHEERRIYPIVAEVDPTAVQRLMLQHRQQASEIACLRELARQTEATTHDNGLGIERLYLEFSRFVAGTLLHLYEEETLTNQTLLLACDRALVTSVQSSIMNDMGPDERALFRRALLSSTRLRWRRGVSLGG